MFKRLQKAKASLVFAVWAALMSSASVAVAQTASPAPAQPSTLEVAFPFLVMILVFYFLLIRPQIKKQREHQKVLSELKKGQSVVLSSGILGTIEGLTEKFVTLEISPGVKIKVLKSSVSGGFGENNTEGKTK